MILKKISSDDHSSFPSPSFQNLIQLFAKTTLCLKHKYNAQFHHQPVFPMMRLYQLWEDTQMEH